MKFNYNDCKLVPVFNENHEISYSYVNKNITYLNVLLLIHKSVLLQ